MSRKKLGSRRGISEIISAMLVLFISLVASVTIYNLAITSFNRYADDYTHQIETTQKRIEERFTVTSIYRQDPTLSDLVDYVDTTSTIEGTHSDFSSMQSGPDSNYDTLSEGNTGTGGNNIEDFVDSQSNEDESEDIGTHNVFNNMKAGPDGGFDSLIEENTGNVTGNSTLLSDDFEDSLYINWSSDWERRNGEGYSGSYSVEADYFDSYLESIDLDADDAFAIYIEFWFRCESIEKSGPYEDSLDLFYWDGNDWIHQHDTSFFVDAGDEGAWILYSDKIIESQFYVNDFKIRFENDFSGYNDLFYVDNIVIKKETEVPNYNLDLEVQWTSVNYVQTNEELCIYGGSMGLEDLKVEVWDGSNWNTLPGDLSNGWNNYTISSYLDSSTFTIRFKDGTDSGDVSQDSWQIDTALLHLWSPGTPNYEMDIEIQWNSVDYSKDNGELCIYGGSMGLEDLKVEVWDGSNWNTLPGDLSNGWNNYTISSYLDSSTFTTRFKGVNEEGDTNFDEWEVDVALLHLWDDTGSDDIVVYVYNYGMREIEIDKVYVDGEEYSFIPQGLSISVGEIKQITLDPAAPDSGNLVIVSERGTSYETYYETE